ncbi:MAG: hypothetical protein JXA77_10615 [Bacteroidales bacterium]|nr:hypothetical protein [Bacteroidales bacterium]MBN2820527.1 hypothetical protein [Bacteroidales bacterium]
MRLEIYDSNELNFVELNITGGNDTLVRCDKESKYVDTVVFNLFAPCFENANKLYEYYGPTKFNSRKIIPLRNELMKYRDDLKALDSLEKFEKYISSHFLGVEFLEEIKKSFPNYKDTWKQHLEDVIKINDDLIAITEKCAFEERILWIVGY